LFDLARPREIVCWMNTCQVLAITAMPPYRSGNSTGINYYYNAGFSSTAS
jgi:hypothetical protein